MSLFSVMAFLLLVACVAVAKGAIWLAIAVGAVFCATPVVWLLVQLLRPPTDGD